MGDVISIVHILEARKYREELRSVGLSEYLCDYHLRLGEGHSYSLTIVVTASSKLEAENMSKELLENASFELKSILSC